MIERVTFALTVALLLWPLSTDVLPWCQPRRRGR